jgi:hypothetical protein
VRLCLCWSCLRREPLGALVLLACSRSKQVSCTSIIMTCELLSRHDRSDRWYGAGVGWHDSTATWTDGTSSVLGSRERAQVLTDAEGDVIVLYNGVSGGVGAPGQSYTLATPTAAYRAEK